MIRGIGPVYAKKLLRAFGEKVFDVIEAEPNRLREVDGIGPLRAKRVGSFRWIGFATAVLIESTGGIGEVQEGSVSPNTDTRSATCSGVR